MSHPYYSNQQYQEPYPPSQPPVLAQHPYRYPYQHYPLPRPPAATDNTMALVGMILSCISLFTLGFLSVPGFVCSFIGYRRACEVWGQPGKGMAVAGMWIGGAVMFVGLLCLGFIIAIFTA